MRLPILYIIDTNNEEKKKEHNYHSNTKQLATENCLSLADVFRCVCGPCIDGLGNIDHGALEKGTNKPAFACGITTVQM